MLWKILTVSPMMCVYWMMCIFTHTHTNILIIDEYLLDAVSMHKYIHTYKYLTYREERDVTLKE